jgi:hypothetical protein
MKKITLIALIGPVLLIVLRIIDVLKKVSTYGLDNNYSCGITIERECSLSYYIFRSDDAVIFYLGFFLSFVLLFVITGYIFFLIKLYRDNNHKFF